MTRREQKSRYQAARRAARRKYVGVRGVDVEPDANVQLTTDGGAFVEAFVWVSFEEISDETARAAVGDDPTPI